MNVVDAMALVLLAVAALALVARRRLAGNRREDSRRLARSLRLALQNEAFAQAIVPQKRLLRRAS